jgi:hypothetical protein
MQRATVIAFVLVVTGCSNRERCEVATYEGGCDGKRAWTICADKETVSGRKKLWPTIVRRECLPNTECVEAGEQATCVAEPAQRCDVPNATRCVDGRHQVCWEVRKGDETTGVYYWKLLEGGC